MSDPVVVPMAWRDVPGGVRVQLPTGRVVRILDRPPGMPHLVAMRSAAGVTRFITVDPGAMTNVLFGPEEMAVASLKARFTHVEFIREGY